MSGAELPSVSVIVNTLNRARYLDDALKAIALLDYPNLEIIVVNGPSTDDTEQVLARWKGRVKLGSCDEANLSMSRNVGIALAAGEIVCFIDDDAAPHPAWARKLAEGFRDPRVAGVGGFTIDNTGVQWQARKTICDRFGNAYHVSDYFDERPLCRPGSPFYPSLLGTNSSFRASALRSIGGFDEAFAYLLDETDVCLRLIDAGWRVLYEPEALVFHQFAPSHIRSADRVARTLYPSAVSKGYFAERHGAALGISESADELDRYRREILHANAWLEDEGRIDSQHRFSLDQDLVQGLHHGADLARSTRKSKGDLDEAVEAPAFKPLEGSSALRVAFVSRGYPPDEGAGIARWTSMAAEGLRDRGHCVHVITEASGEAETVEFRDGLWLHRVAPLKDSVAALSEAYAIPQALAAWSGRVWREVQFIKSFGLDVVSFPIWDLEGLPLIDDEDLAVSVSLHTTYAMAKPFKPEWNLRPLFEHTVVDRVVEAERKLLARAPTLLANSRAVLSEIEAVYGFSVEKRSTLVPHGTLDPLVSRKERAAERNRRAADGERLRVLFVGRFEPRKGFDISVRTAHELARDRRFELLFVGDVLDAQDRRDMAAWGAASIEGDPDVSFLGVVERERLDDLYADCDLVVVPSRFESFGLVAIEAMAAGRPVLGLAAGGLREIVQDGVTGRLWSESDDMHRLIADEIRGLDQDRDRLLRLGRDARRAFERSYSVSAMAAGLEAALRSAATRKNTERAA